jgi:hypothetical protein
MVARIAVNRSLYQPVQNPSSPHGTGGIMLDSTYEQLTSRKCFGLSWGLARRPNSQIRFT